MSQTKKEVPFSEQWLQIGVTFCPIPSRLWGRKKEILTKAQLQDIGPLTPPVQIDGAIAKICRAMK